MMRLEMRLTKDSIEVIGWLMEIAETNYSCDKSEAAEKVKAWLTEKTEELNGTSPLMLINTGKAHIVLKSILHNDPF